MTSYSNQIQLAAHRTLKIAKQYKFSLLVTGLLFFSLIATIIAVNSSSSFLFRKQAAQNTQAVVQITTPTDNLTQRTPFTVSSQASQPIAFVRGVLSFDTSKVILTDEPVFSSALSRVVQKTSKSAANEAGSISFALAIDPQQASTAPTDIAELALLYFAPVPGVSDTQTTISFVIADMQIVYTDASVATLAASNITVPVNRISPPTPTVTSPATTPSTVPPTTAPSSTPTILPTVAPTVTSVPTQAPTATPTQPSVTVTPATGTPLSFNATYDVRISDKDPDDNYGGRTSMRTDYSPGESFLLQFNVSGLSTQTVSKAVIRLYSLGNSTAAGDLHYISNNNWTEDSVTWLNAPQYAGTPRVAIGSAPSGTWVEIDVTQFISGNGTYSFRGVNTSDDDASFATQERAQRYTPVLVITP